MNKLNVTLVLVWVMVAIVGCALITETSTTHAPPIFLPTETPTPTATPTPVPKVRVVLGDPIKYPRTLTELWELVEAGEEGWVFDKCKEDELIEPVITWEQGVDLFTNTPDEFEDDGYGLFILLFFDHKDGQFTLGLCGDDDGKPILYGEGARYFLLWYDSPEEFYHSEEYI
jgi:hypothetical protein